MIADFLALEFRAEAQSIYAWLICGAALFWGGGPERATALVWLLLFKFGDAAYHAIFDYGFQLIEVDFFHAGLDLTAALAWVLIALYANRNYPLWIAAMQILAATAHMARGIAEQIAPIAYAVMAFTPAYFILLFLTIGLVRHVMRKRKYGKYRDWRAPLVTPFKAKSIPDILKGQS